MLEDVHSSEELLGTGFWGAVLPSLQKLKVAEGFGFGDSATQPHSGLETHFKTQFRSTCALTQRRGLHQAPETVLVEVHPSFYSLLRPFYIRTFTSLHPILNYSPCMGLLACFTLSRGWNHYPTK